MSLAEYPAGSAGGVAVPRRGRPAGAALPNRSSFMLCSCAGAAL